MIQPLVVHGFQLSLVFERLLLLKLEIKTLFQIKKNLYPNCDYEYPVSFVSEVLYHYLISLQALSIYEYLLSLLIFETI